MPMDIKYLTIKQMDILEQKVSFYSRIQDPNNGFTASIGSLLKSIKCGGKNRDIANRIQCIRGNIDKDTRDNLKRQLPVIMWQGIFDKRGKSGLKSLSGILCIDIDHKTPDELTTLRNQLVNVPWVLAFFLSPSGDGLKVLVKSSITTPEEYENCYAQLIDLFPQLFQFRVDVSCQEYSKTCYASYDPNLYINPNIQDFPFVYDPYYDKPKSKSSGQSATGIAGSYFQVDTPTAQELFVNNLNAQMQNLTDEDILKILDRKFHRYPRNYEVGHRRDAIFKQSIVLCKAGISQSKATEYLKAQFLPLDFPANELEAEVVKAYANFQVQYGSERGQYSNYETYKKRQSK